MNIIKKWWFWAILLVVLIVIIFLWLYASGKDGSIGENKCTSQGCGKCYNSCIPWEVEIRVSCPAPTETFECECIDHKCVKV